MFSFWLIFSAAILPALGGHQPWQMVSHLALEEIFQDQPFNLSDFYRAQNIDEVFDLCDNITAKITSTEKYNSSIALELCRDFFTNRKNVQTFLDGAFAWMVKHGKIPPFVAAIEKSYYLHLDRLTNNDFLDSFGCYNEKSLRHRRGLSLKISEKYHFKATHALVESIKDFSLPFDDAIAFSDDRQHYPSRYGIALKFKAKCVKYDKENATEIVAEEVATTKEPEVKTFEI